MTELQQERAARNQSVFRDVNERIRDLTEAQREQGGQLLCECADLTCSARIEMTLEEYEGIREHGNRFVVLPGHESSGVEVAVDASDRYLVVEKVDAGAVVAHRLDPRAGE